jgi:predicted  nucleic acid-binding Zn-ribbon protein
LQQRLDSLRHEEITLTHLLQEKREEMTSIENCLTYLFNEYNVLQDEVSEGQSQISILNEQTTVMSH